MPSGILDNIYKAKELERIFQTGNTKDVFSYTLNSSWSIVTLVGKVHVIGHILIFYPESNSLRVMLFPQTSRVMRSLTGAQVLRLMAGREDTKSIVYLEKLRAAQPWPV